LTGPSGGATGGATFELLKDQRSRVAGALDFDTVTHLLTTGAAAIGSGDAAIIDLSGVTSSDSAGLALLIEWLSVAREAGRSLRYENVSAQIKQLAVLSEVDELLLPV
jgi:phospholipid transport system transporter-binding protein